MSFENRISEITFICIVTSASLSILSVSIYYYLYFKTPKSLRTIFSTQLLILQTADVLDPLTYMFPIFIYAFDSTFSFNNHPFLCYLQGIGF